MSEYDGEVKLLEVGSVNAGQSIIQNEMKQLKSYNNIYYILNEKLLKLTNLLNQSDNEYHISQEEIRSLFNMDQSNDNQFNDRTDYYNQYKEIYQQQKQLKKENIKINIKQPKIAEATIIEFKRLANQLQNNNQLFGYLLGNENSKIGSFLVLTEQLDLNDQGIAANDQIKEIIKLNSLSRLYGIIIINGKITQQQEEQLMKINSQGIEDGIYLIKIQKYDQDIYELWKDGKKEIINNQQTLLKYVKNIRFYKL